jgi:uncharacterized SAM-binding protein YcdF (DUF218 family)
VRAVCDVAADRTRVVAVLGYSRRGDSAIHEIGLQRLLRAQELSEPTDSVILSGRGRARGGTEAALMAAAWRGNTPSVVPEAESSSTVQNARAIARYAAEMGADEVMVITSSWHRPRAALLLRAAFRGRHVRLRVVAAPRTWPLVPVLREAACLVLLPVQLLRVLLR